MQVCTAYRPQKSMFSLLYHTESMSSNQLLYQYINTLFY